MKSLAGAMLVVLPFALEAVAQTPSTSTSTRCQTEDVTVFETVIERRLTACGEGFTDNVLWHLDRADARDGQLDGAVTRPATGKGALVYLLDTGVMQMHDEFMRAEGSVVIDGLSVDGAITCSGGISAALDPCFSTVSSLMVMGHGTGTASVIAGRNTGIAPDAKIVSVVTLFPGGDPTAWSRVLDAVIAHAWAPTTPQVETAIISMSSAPGLASRPSAAFPPFEAKMRAMIEGVDRDGNRDPAGKKFLFVVLAGNATEGGGSHCRANMDTDIFPSVLGPSIDGLITVGGIDESNRVWERSCKGPAVEILAPATNMLVASPSARDHYRSSHHPAGTYPANSGTSFATPYIAGLAALVLERNPKLTPAQIEAVLRTHSSRLADGDVSTAFGRVGAFMVPRERRRSAGH